MVDAMAREFGDAYVHAFQKAYTTIFADTFLQEVARERSAIRREPQDDVGLEWVESDRAA